MTSSSPFWKKSPKPPGGSKKAIAGNYADEIPSKHKLSFKEFEHHTEDAWDASDDDLLRQSIGRIKIHPEHAVASAKTVLDNYSKLSPADKNIQIKKLTEKSEDDIKTNNNKEENLSKSPIGLKMPGGATRQLNLNKENNETRATVSALPTANHHPPDEMSDERISNTEQIGASSATLPQSSSAPKVQSIRSPLQTNNRIIAQITKFQEILDGPTTDIVELRNLSWSGVPSNVRADTWRILCDYLPANKDRRDSTLKRKRQEYFNFVENYFEKEKQGLHKETFHQIHIDIPRTNPLIPLFQQQVVQDIFERLLFIWAVRHPASGYVQGINDLVTPFFVVFLSNHLAEKDEVENFNVSNLSEDVLHEMEADTFWCTTKLLDGIQDNYTFAQPGVQTKVQRLQGLIKRIDDELHSHLVGNQVEYLQFAFRWMNNLLMREIPLGCTIRLWDTYIAESEGFSDFHLYVCVAFLRHWRNQLLAQKDFQGLLLSLQNFPTTHWADEEINLLLAEAFRLRYTYSGAQSHLGPKP